MPRRPTLLVLLLALAMVAAGCGSDNDATARASDAASTSSADAQFPVTVEHKFGATEIDAGPQRIVSIGYQEHDVLYALGVQPVAVRYWFGDTDDVIFPWAEGDASGADPEILNMAYGELNYEKIAALRPDLILGVYSGITDKEYETLSAIAPTVAQPDGYVDFGIPWQGRRPPGGHRRRPPRPGRGADRRARGEIRRGPRVISRVGRPAGRGGRLPARRHRSVRLRGPASPVLHPARLRGARRHRRGGRREVLRNPQPRAVDVVDGDLIVWDQMTHVEGGRAAIIADPVVAGLQAMKEGRAIYMEGDLEAAFAFNSVLSLGFVLDEVVPLLEAATDGDPDTTG